MTDPDWWRGAVIYQIYPRSFLDTNGDGIGDLPGVTARLDHVADLGADAIWLCPFFVSPQRDFGYDVADHRAVDPIFGSMADFDALLARAHALGLQGADRPGLEPHLRPPSLVSRQPRRAQRAARRLVCLGGSRCGRDAAEQLAFGVRRRGLELGAAAAAILPAPFPQPPARAQPAQSGGGRRHAGNRAVLAGARRGRVPPGCRGFPAA